MRPARADVRSRGLELIATGIFPVEPLIVQGDHTVLLEVDSPRYVEARDGRFAVSRRKYSSCRFAESSRLRTGSKVSLRFCS